MRIEIACVDCDRELHHLDPFLAVLVVGRDYLLFELVVEVDGVLGFVVLDEAVLRRLWAYRPAGPALDAALYPPAIEHGEVHDAVVDALHSARAGGFARAHRRVEPEVDARGYELRGAHVVVLDEDDGKLRAELLRDAVDVLEHVLAGLVVRMRLAREDELHLAARYLDEALDVREDEVGSLVGRGAAREAYRQHVGV